MARTGRKRKVTAKREANGQKQRQWGTKAEREVMGVALAQPHRRGERSQFAGTALGRLLLARVLTEEQYNAGETYGRIAARYMASLDAKWRNESGMAMLMGSGTTSVRVITERDPEDAAAARRAVADVHAELRHYRLLHAKPALYRLCLLDIDPVEGELGDIKAGLNILAKLWTAQTIRSRSRGASSNLVS